jgi:hypothetical protein
MFLNIYGSNQLSEIQLFLFSWAAATSTEQTNFIALIDTTSIKKFVSTVINAMPI